jgi:aspartyl/asparaginyl-tRNA synthetase
MWKVEGWVEKRLSTANLRFIEIRNTNAAAKVGVLELVAATKPDIVLTMEVEQPGLL